MRKALICLIFTIGKKPFNCASNACQQLPAWISPAPTSWARRSGIHPLRTLRLQPVCPRLALANESWLARRPTGGLVSDLAFRPGATSLLTLYQPFVRILPDIQVGHLRPRRTLLPIDPSNLRCLNAAFEHKRHLPTECVAAEGVVIIRHKNVHRVAPKPHRLLCRLAALMGSQGARPWPRTDKRCQT